MVEWDYLPERDNKLTIGMQNIDFANVLASSFGQGEMLFPIVFVIYKVIWQQINTIFVLRRKIC